MSVFFGTKGGTYGSIRILKAIIDNFGSAIVVPFIIFIIALIFRVKPAKAFLSALYAGVSLEGFH